MKSATGVIYYTRPGSEKIKQWDVHIDAEKEDENYLKRHLAKWVPTATFVRAEIIIDPIP